MKMLLIHCDYFSYASTRRTKFAEEISDECKSCGIKDVLAAFITVEKNDADNQERVIDMAIEETVKKAKEVGTKTVVVYPFVHLSEEISPPDVANRIVADFSKRLKTAGYSVNKAPFGWEKVFSLTSKGHPLAESFRNIKP